MSSKTAVFRPKPDVTSPPRKRLKADDERDLSSASRALDYTSPPPPPLRSQLQSLDLPLHPLSDNEIEAAQVTLPEMLVFYLSCRYPILAGQLLDVHGVPSFRISIKFSFGVFDVERRGESVLISKYAIEDDSKYVQTGPETRKSITSIAIHYEINHSPNSGLWSPVLARMLSCQQTLTNVGTINAFAQILARDLVWAFYNGSLQGVEVQM